mmetsp:Transcript_111118/g.227461  ORF Transcript_111118/g.227461 Transcript_111118/m.227461 type:complete len:87 (-) Transcript_111118:216-476(-)
MSITPGLLQNESFADFTDVAVKTTFVAIGKQKHPQCPDAKYVFLLVVLHDIKLMVVLHDIKLSPLISVDAKFRLLQRRIVPARLRK